ncbi:hypothetical protein [Methanocella arvoryzae]|nr:hypothetical protein [Methanocella arvoryzae]
MPETKDPRQMSPDEFYDAHIKPYALLYLVFEFIGIPAILLTGWFLLGKWPAWVVPMIFVYFALNIASIWTRGRSMGGIRLR